MSRYIVECTGDMFQSQAEVYGHGVNIRGFMGAGIAKQFREKYPENYQSYKIDCDHGWLLPGEAMMHINDERSIIANIASQDDPGPNARLSWLTLGLNDMYLQVRNYEAKFAKPFTVALPQIGCGIGGLDWDVVRPIMIDYADFWKIRTELWTYGN